MFDGFEFSSILSESDCVPASACSSVCMYCSPHIIQLPLRIESVETRTIYFHSPFVHFHTVSLGYSHTLVVTTPLVCVRVDVLYYSKTYVATVSMGHVGN